MNSRQKGKVGERELASLLREHGYAARRGQQFSGAPDSPDVVCEALSWLHFEVKRCERVDLRSWCAQAEGDSGGKYWAIQLRWNHGPWLTVILSELFFQIIREFEPVAAPQANGPNGTDSTPHPVPLPDRGGEGDGAHGVTRPTETISGLPSGGPEQQHQT